MKISIITVTWNSSATLRNTMESVLYQTYSDIEHIIIDGGSSDSTILYTNWNLGIKVVYAISVRKTEAYMMQ